MDTDGSERHPCPSVFIGGFKQLALFHFSFLRAGWLALKIQPQTELNLPGFTDGGRDNPDGSAVGSGIRRTEIRVVGQVEELGPELEALVFGQVPALGEAEVHVDHAVGVEDVEPAGPQHVLGWKLERGGVELLDGEIIDMSPIGSFHGGVTNYLNEIFTAASKRRYIPNATTFCCMARLAQC